MSPITDSELQRYITGAQNHLVVINKVINKLKDNSPPNSCVQQLETLCIETRNYLSKI